MFLLLSMQGSFGFLSEGDRTKAAKDYILQVTTLSMMLFIEYILLLHVYYVTLFLWHDMVPLIIPKPFPSADMIAIFYMNLIPNGCHFQT